jgi:branched-chain amino acid aminotransferase/4-amino-4-deoxychorismate lyase
MTALALDDRGFTVGHGLFETVLWADGRLEHWAAHLARLARGCPQLGLPAPDPAVALATAEAALAEAGSPGRAAVRLNWSAGSGGRGLDPPADLRPRLTALAVAVGPPPEALALATARVRRNDRSPTSRLKTLAYLDNVLARAEARAAGADEALMLNTAGEVACAAAANVFWIRHGEVFTPTLDAGVLDGVMRAQAIAACRQLGAAVEEVYATPGRLAGSPMFLTNSLIGVTPVTRLDGEILPASPLVAKIAQAVSRARK